MQFVTMLLYFINTIHLCVKICVAAVHVLRNKEVVILYMFFFNFKTKHYILKINLVKTNLTGKSQKSIGKNKFKMEPYLPFANLQQNKFNMVYIFFMILSYKGTISISLIKKKLKWSKLW